MVASLVGLAAVVALLPILGDETVSFAERISSYALAVFSSGALVYGLLALLDARLRRTPRLLLGAVLGDGGVLAVLLGGRPEYLAAPSALPLALLFAADALRVAAVSLALARQVSSPGAALLVAAASASDLFSVFAGPIKAPS